MRALRAAVVAALALSGASANAEALTSAYDADPEALRGAYDADAIDRAARAAFDDGKYAFCTDPIRPLGTRQRELCALSREVDGCEGYAKACDAALTPKSFEWLERLAEWVGPIARIAVYVFVFGIVVALLVPVASALLRLRRKRRDDRARAPEPNLARAVEEETIAAPAVADAEAALRAGDEHRARGELERAIALYLAASLSALGGRGAIRVARHRTNGEYVRSCSEEASRPLLREVVREADSAAFGGAPPSEDAARRVAERAKAIVRAAAVVSMAMLCLSCGAARPGADPAGDELPREVLERSGLSVESLGGLLARMPIPGAEDEAPLVLVDLERVPLDDEARAHVVRWVEAGGRLVLFGAPQSWPPELAADAASASTRDLVVRAPSDEEEAPVEIEGARVALPQAFTWRDPAGADPIALLGESTYASRRRIGRGVALGVANGDLFTNVGVLPPRNAAALVAIVFAAASEGAESGEEPSYVEVRVARAEDGAPPPASPFAALVAAGLGKGAWHALAAALLLFLSFGVRHARPRPVQDKARRAFAEHVEATGAFYARARALTHALGAYGRFIDLRLRELLPRGADPVAFLASRSGAPPERVAELHARATQIRAEDPPLGDEHEVIEELHGIVARALAREDRRVGRRGRPVSR